MKKIVLGVLAVSLSLALGASTGFAAKKPKYKEGAAGAGSISGTVMLKGNAPPPIMEDLNKGKNVEFCVTNPTTLEGGMRARIKVAVDGGKLKDVVVLLKELLPVSHGVIWVKLITISNYAISPRKWLLSANLPRLKRKQVEYLLSQIMILIFSTTRMVIR